MVKFNYVIGLWIILYTAYPANATASAAPLKKGVSKRKLYNIRTESYHISRLFASLSFGFMVNVFQNVFAAIVCPPRGLHAAKKLHSKILIFSDFMGLWNLPKMAQNVSRIGDNDEVGGHFLVHDFWGPIHPICTKIWYTYSLYDARWLLSFFFRNSK